LILLSRSVRTLKSKLKTLLEPEMVTVTALVTVQEQVLVTVLETV
jgi:hypothetical protein